MNTVTIAGVKFPVTEIKEKIRDGYIYLETGRKVYQLITVNGVIKASLIFKADKENYPLPLTKRGRYFLRKTCDYL